MQFFRNTIHYIVKRQLCVHHSTYAGHDPDRFLKSELPEEVEMVENDLEALLLNNI